jgi:hypothetical protein
LARMASTASRCLAFALRVGSAADAVPAVKSPAIRQHKIALQSNPAMVHSIEFSILSSASPYQ